MFRKTLPATCLTSLLLCSSAAATQQTATVRTETPQAAGTEARFLNPPGLPAASGYSHVVDAPAGRTVHVSGQLPLDKDGTLVGAGDFAAQAEQVFANLKTALTAAGASFDDVVKLDMYVTDMSRLKALRNARDRYINLQRPPASTLVQVDRFVRDDAMVEIAAMAVVHTPVQSNRLQTPAPGP